MELKEQIVIVANLRLGAGRLIDRLVEYHQSWESEHQHLIDSVANSKQGVAEAEEKLRELTIRAFLETGSKVPAPGVGIREVTTYEYDSDKALGWAKEHGLALKLDEAKFKNHIKADPPDFVAVGKEITATIAQKLEEVGYGKD